MRLLIFKVNQLGDNLVFLPVVQELRRRFPNWDLGICTSPLAEALYEGVIPRSDRRFVVPTQRFNGSWKRPADFWQLWRRVVAFGPNACLIADDQANVAYLLAFLSGATRRIALRRPFIKVGALASRLLPELPGEKVVQTNWRIAGTLVEELGGHWPAVPPPPDLSHLLAPGGDGNPTRKNGRVVIHAGASRAYQRWFPERYAELANRLVGQAGMEVWWIDTPVPGDPPELSPAVARVATPPAPGPRSRAERRGPFRGQQLRADAPRQRPRPPVRRHQRSDGLRVGPALARRADVDAA